MLPLQNYTKPFGSHEKIEVGFDDVIIYIVQTQQMANIIFPDVGYALGAC
jgi:hypothetical protein